MEKSINQSVKYLAEDRRRLLHKPTATSDAKLVSLIREVRLKDLLTANGRASISYFTLFRQGKIRVRDINRAELHTLAAHLIDRNLVPVLTDCVALNVPTPDADSRLLYWSKGLVNLNKLSSKDFRQANDNREPICIYKIGAILTPLENASWTYKLMKLRSTRHKNTLLRIAHGDCYSKERLYRFGLVDNPHCDACGQVENIVHKVLECPVKMPIWRNLARQEGIDLNTLAEPIEFALGMYKNSNLTSLTIHAELVQLLIGTSPRMSPSRTLEVIKNKLAILDERFVEQ